MPEHAEMEVRTVHGREFNVRWKSPRFGEWLAWCYLASPNLWPSEGVGFEARAGSAEEAKAALLQQVEAHLSAGA